MIEDAIGWTRLCFVVRTKNYACVCVCDTGNVNIAACASA